MTKEEWNAHWKEYCQKCLHNMENPYGRHPDDIRCDLGCQPVEPCHEGSDYAEDKNWQDRIKHGWMRRKR